MSEHHYPIRVLAGDYARAGVGLALTGGPLLFVPASPVMIGILGGLATLFLVFGVRTAVRQMTVVRLSEDGVVAAGPLGTAVPWNKLGAVDLAYYSTRRDRRGGWMQLRLRGGGTTIRIDSTIDGFQSIARAASRAAEVRALSIHPRTAGNFAALGIAVTETASEPGGHFGA